MAPGRTAPGTRGSEPQGARLRDASRKRSRGRKQEAAGLFFFFLDQPALAPDWPQPVTRPAGQAVMVWARSRTWSGRCLRRARAGSSGAFWGRAAHLSLGSGENGVQGPGHWGVPHGHWAPQPSNCEDTVAGVSTMSNPALPLPRGRCPQAPGLARSERETQALLRWGCTGWSF